MSNSLRRDPLRGLGQLRDTMNRILEDGLNAVGGPVLAIDMYETDEAVIIEAGPLVGVKPEDLEVSITANVLTIRGDSQANPPDAGLIGYIRRERQVGRFNRSVSIPRTIKSEDAVASFREGTLIITVPKAEEGRPRVISVETKVS